jgi:dihydrofolate synthase/folylpolyglutamate synthase
LYSLGNEVKTIKLGLERIAAILQAMGNPQLAYDVVHVAGTNGKGSTCAMMESALRAEGRRTGLYTSPHLLEPTERIQVGGAAVTKEEFAAAFARVHGVAERLMESGEIDGHPTYFETVTAMAFQLFQERAVEIAVIEVGLGGRLDATNVVEPRLCVITQVDFDHEAWLGSSIEAIAGEKAGILKPGVPAVISRQRIAAREVIEARAKRLGAPITHSEAFEVDGLEMHAHGCRYRSRGYAINCPLAGEHQVENSRTALAALDALGLSQQAIETGMEQTRWPGRLERVAQRPDVIVDGAHNPAGVRALAGYMERFFSGRRVWLIYGTMRDKSFGEIGEMLAPVASEVILTAPASQRALHPETLAEAFDHPRLRCAANLDAALELTRDAGPEDVIFITGSLVLAGEALGRFRKGASWEKGA